MHVFLTLALVGGECQPQALTTFPWRKGTQVNYWIGGWVDPGDGLDGMDGMEK
jgi:hypothetical protein